MSPRLPPADASTPDWLRRCWHTPWPGMALVVLLCCAPLFMGVDRADLESDGLRFMDALMGSLAFLYVFAIGRRLAGPVCGLAAALLLVAHGQLLFTQGLRTDDQEASLVLAYCGGIYHFLAWRSPNPDVKRHIVAMALYFVLGFVTTFVAVLFLPIVVGIAALLTRPDRARLYRDWRAFAWTSVLAVALIALFGQLGYLRLTGGPDPAHLQPWSFYFAQVRAELRVAGTMLLTSAGALMMLAHTVRRRRVEGVVVILWFIVPVAVMSAGTSNLYHSVYPFLPPVALAGGYALAAIAGWLSGSLARLASPAGPLVTPPRP